MKLIFFRQNVLENAPKYGFRLGLAIVKIATNKGVLRFVTDIPLMALPEIPIDQLIDQILAARRISRKDQNYVMSILLSKPRLSDKEQRQISQIYDGLRSGRIRVVD